LMTREEFRLAFSEDVAVCDFEFCEMAESVGGDFPELSNGGLTRLTDIAAAIAEPLFERIAELERPVDLRLYCPICGYQHTDEPQPEKGWTNPPHKSHECQFCGHTWRPADVHTNGVETIKTKGQRDGDPTPRLSVNAELLAATESCEQILMTYGDP